MPVTAQGFSSPTVTDGSLPLLPATLPFLPLRLFYVDAFGADPTGATDSTAAFAAAQAAAGSGAYQLVLSAGTYVLGTSQNLITFGRLQGMTGQGSHLTTVTYKGTATCVPVFDSSFNSSLSIGGRFRGFTINGSAAGASATGMSWGNLAVPRCDDIRILNFSGASATGLALRNGIPGNSEQGEWTGINLVNNTVGVLFDTGSFDYSLYQFLIVANPGQDGVRLQNDAALEGVRLEVRGNFFAGAGNTGAVFALDRGNAAGTSRIDGDQIYVNVECDGSTGAGHFTIKADGGSSSQFTGTGVLQFNDETISFQGTSLTGSAQVGFSGRVHEHTMGFMSPGDGLAVQGGSLWTERGSLTTGLPGTIFLKAGDFHAYQLANGNNTIAFGSLLTRVRKIELYLAQPASGAAGTVTWPANVWFQGGVPSLSTANGAVDRVRLTYLPVEGNWYGEVTTSYTASSSSGSAVSPVNVSGASETAIATITIPAGLPSGATYRIRVWGTFAMGATGAAYTVRSKIGGLGGAQIGGIGSTAWANNATGTFTIDGMIQLQQNGASANWTGDLRHMGRDSTGAVVTNAGMAGNGTKDSTVAQTFVITLTLGNAANSASATGFIAERTA